MIAKIFIQIIIMIVLSDIYIDTHYLRHDVRYNWWKRLLWWLPGVGMLVYTISLASIDNFAPTDLTWLNVYLMLISTIFVPKAIFAILSSLGWLYTKFSHTRKNWGNIIAPIFILFVWIIIIYGSFFGFYRFEVNHIDYYSKDLPASFEGYRIVHFSDAHVGTFTGSRQKILTRAVDSINAQHADVVAFTGDLQNMQPSEINPVRNILASIQAKDGVYSVLGNHDYSHYVGGTTKKKQTMEREMVTSQRSIGWKLLMNESAILRRGNDSIVIAGEENGGSTPDVNRADLKKTMYGVSSNSFVVMLQHDPAVWQTSILPQSKAQLTLSGHTHGGQISLFGVRPTNIVNPNDCGLYLEGERALYVTHGIGGLIPFRFNMPGEIVVITLHKLK